MSTEQMTQIGELIIQGVIVLTLAGMIATIGIKAIIYFWKSF